QIMSRHYRDSALLKQDIGCMVIGTNGPMAGRILTRGLIAECSLLKPEHNCRHEAEKGSTQLVTHHLDGSFPPSDLGDTERVGEGSTLTRNPMSALINKSFFVGRLRFGPVGYKTALALLGTSSPNQTQTAESFVTAWRRARQQLPS